MAGLCVVSGAALSCPSVAVQGRGPGRRLSRSSPARRTLARCVSDGGAGDGVSERLRLIAGAAVGAVRQLDARAAGLADDGLGGACACYASASANAAPAVPRPLKLAAGLMGPMYVMAAGQNPTLPLIAAAVASFIKIYLLLLFVRVLLAWFPNIDWSGGMWNTLRQVTDPYLNLFRNFIPPAMGSIDFSPIIGFLVLQWLAAVLQGGTTAADGVAAY